MIRIARLIMVVTALSVASVASAGNVAWRVLSDVADECRKVSGCADVVAPLDSIIGARGENIDCKTSLEAVLVAMTKLYDRLEYSAVAKAGMICSEALAENNLSGSEEIRTYIHILDYFGYCCQRMGLYRELSDSYFRALDIARSENMEEEEAVLLNNIGSLYYKTKNYDKAMAMYADAISINERCKSHERLFVNYNNMSSVHVKRNNLDKGLEYAYLALHQLDSVGNADMSRLMLRNIASIYSMKGMKRHAIAMLRSILDYQEQNRRTAYLGALSCR